METFGHWLPKTPQNHAITPSLNDQEYPFCIQNLRIWPKTKPFVLRPPSIQVSFFVSFFETAFLTHSLHAYLKFFVGQFPAQPQFCRVSDLTLNPNFSRIACPKTSSINNQILQTAPYLLRAVLHFLTPIFLNLKISRRYTDSTPRFRPSLCQVECQVFRLLLGFGNRDLGFASPTCESQWRFSLITCILGIGQMQMKFHPSFHSRFYSRIFFYPERSL